MQMCTRTMFLGIRQSACWLLPEGTTSIFVQTSTIPLQPWVSHCSVMSWCTSASTDKARRGSASFGHTAQVILVPPNTKRQRMLSKTEFFQISPAAVSRAAIPAESENGELETDMAGDRTIFESN